MKTVERGHRECTLSSERGQNTGPPEEGWAKGYGALLDPWRVINTRRERL